MKSYARATTGIAIGTTAADQSSPIKSDVMIDKKLPMLEPSNSDNKR
jgi:hypothetical protein